MRRKAALWRLSGAQTGAQPPVSTNMKAHEQDYRVEEEEDDDDSSLTDSEPSEECEDDRCRGPELPVWHCVDCDSSYCRLVIVATMVY